MLFEIIEMTFNKMKVFRKQFDLIFNDRLFSAEHEKIAGRDCT